MKKKIIVIVSFFILLLAIFIAFRFFSPQKIAKEYSAVVLNIDDYSLVETTTVKIEGETILPIPFIRDRPIFKGKVSINNISATLEENALNDLVFYKNEVLDNMWSALNYYSYDENSFIARTATIGILTIENIKMNKLSIELLPEYKNKNIGLYIVAPVNNLDEAIQIYKDIMLK